MAPVHAEWIAVDWGTTNMRAWAMAGDRPLATACAPRGMGSLSRDEFEPALLDAIQPWLDGDRVTQVVACGMVGARQGWAEAPYAAVPSAPHDPRAMRKVEARDARIAVTIVHGLSQADPPDVMRGEETQIAGLLALEPGFAGTACLPGTHSKWAAIRGGRIERFRTFMTGELFALLQRHSVLRHSLEDGAGMDERRFAEAVRESAADPAGIGSRLFAIRAAGLLRDASPAEARARLSGLLIGLEVEAMRRSWAGGEVVLVGQGALSGLYARAIEAAGGRARNVDAEACTLAGLAAAHRAIVRGFRP